MTDSDKTYRIFLSAAEPSADSHCASLITALRQTPYSFEIFGVGGPKMADAGCKLLESTTHRASMTYNAFKHLFHYYRLIRRVNFFLKYEKADLLILCDSPAFNFHIAKAAKKFGIKTLFYVAPQLWAWAPWRIRKLRKYCDKLCCILPFEQDWFTHRGVDTVFVGNPMIARLHSDLAANRKSYAKFDPHNATIALMPGSREAEIKTLWPPMQKIALRIRRRYPHVNFTTVAVDDRRKEAMKSMQTIGFKCSYIIGSVNEAARTADLSIVASGSATLQVAACGCPMVIIYQSNKILWHLVGRWLLTTQYLSLVNILAGKELVPEFMPYFSSIDPIADSVRQLLENTDKLIQISDELINLVEPLGQINASQQVAQVAIDLLAGG